MGMPSIIIAFTEVAAAYIRRGERGIIAMILKDTVPTTNPFQVDSVDDIPDTMTDLNKKMIKMALTGYINPPKRVFVYVLAEPADPADPVDYTPAYQALRTIKFNWLVAPYATTDDVVSDLVSFVKTERQAHNLIKAVLPNANGDHESIVNYATPAAIEGTTTYTAEQYTPRIAGIIAGTPSYMSATYAPCAELTDCTRLTQAEMDAAVDAGKLIIWWDGEKVKTGRAVDSLVTLTQEKNTQFQKIKIVEAMDMISDDIRKTAQDYYIGKYANNYDNKQLLVSAISAYFDKLIVESVMQSYQIGIDVDANARYLKSRGVDVSEMTEEELKRANTGSNVFLKATLSMLDAIEDITLNISI